MRKLIIVLVFIAAITGSILLYRATYPRTPPAPLSAVHTLVTTNTKDEIRFSNPFGVVVASDGTIYVTDGDTNRLWQISPDNTAKLIAENLETPSGIALAPDDMLIVADTGSHTIKRIDPASGSVNIIAGVAHQAGYADGSITEARFNAPIGVAVSKAGLIFVADTYNDAVRVIDVDKGVVRMLAGTNEPGFVDSINGTEARFDTPCGIAVTPDGALVVADTGNHRLRRVGIDGAVSTLAGNGDVESRDGPVDQAAFNEPTGVALGEDGTIYIADTGGSTLRRITHDGEALIVTTMAGSAGVSSFTDGTFQATRFNHLSSVAVAPDGTLVVADTGNKLLRVVVGAGRERGQTLEPEKVAALYPTAAEMRSAAPARWPYDPPESPREIAATFGEIRGEIAEDKQAWFHNGLDIPGAYGETVRALRDEKVLRTLAVESVGTARERIRFPMLGYIHLRVGRNQKDEAFDDRRFVLRRDVEGRVISVRVPRGVRFVAGDPIGTLNNQYHVHMIAGPVGHEMNALAALELPGIKDTVAPTIEENGVQLFDHGGTEFKRDKSSAQKNEKRTATLPRVNTSNGTVEVRGNVRIVVRAYDQMDGNAARRRLGVYRLGYQVLNLDGTPAPGFTEPHMTISFETLPESLETVPLVYWKGSGAGYRGTTLFAYIVTNRVRDREVKEEFWQTSQLAPGDYLVRVFAEDFFGNRTTRDTTVRVVSAS